ncbi:Transcriptional regulator GlxA family, contains an amidase domain and an AraC-type DNA-binding HTH domain [Halopseudomonas litoralis]|uniref:Transcriptional regulator GlxA family, contains an amidase domain and an AraC-type DNA-binding HTH domain n=1 Tax=Halopseudomonas litoralis TaxID=797277 RepID=A0A1H1QFB6_9GAMM|nr:GlxA family transcriptional regulator [Halopseudomonas litoralis]SDS22064.1 Transcriptional regulator GlxA family, contains an amidase domain and an AraC-type DNA-binding HTH domain [Halopseudomonas litoralis]
MKFSSTYEIPSIEDREVDATVKPDLRVGFILMNQFTLVPVAGLVDSLRFAADRSFRSQQIFCKWDWMTCHDQPVTASCGMPVSPTKPLSVIGEYDYVVLAGGLLSETRNPPVWLLDLLRELHQAGTQIIALCSGSFVLGQAGLLDGRRCAVHFTIREEFIQRFPLAEVLTDKSYVDDDGIFTCPGGTAIDLASNLISRHCGTVRAQKGLEYLLVEDEEIQRQTPADKPRVTELHVYKNDMVERAISYMRSHMDAPDSLAAVAQSIGTNERQLHRAFISCTNESPARYWRRLRLDYARQLLMNTNKHVTQIAYATGFSDASHFILWFRKQFGETPNSFRKRRHEIEKLINTGH